MGKIRKIYVIHHSHTDIGYTDLQEQIIYNQVDNIRQAVKLMKRGYEENSLLKKLKWNCETWFCVEKFLESASEMERNSFFALVKQGNIGLSGNYLNFCDLCDMGMLNEKLDLMESMLQQQGIRVKTAMNADVNGISLGMRDAFIDHGIEFLFTNIHTHHGMYPLYQNQRPWYWENDRGQKLLIWSGEHYNLGNFMGMNFSKNIFHDETRYFEGVDFDACMESFYEKLRAYIEEYEESGYPYDFFITSHSGVFSDNAPINPALTVVAEEFNRRYGKDYKMELLTLEQLYEKIYPAIADAPVYRGTMNDWWNNGIGSTPYAVKHYKEALRMGHQADRLETISGIRDPELKTREADNALLYAEHTWGHSSTITNPYDTMVLNLDMRKTGYADRAHEAAAMRKIHQYHALGDVLRYYNLLGKVKAISVAREQGVYPVEFYVETDKLPNCLVADEAGKQVPVQLSSHPRGVLVSFLAELSPLKERVFSYRGIPAPENRIYSRTAWIGQERVKDIVNGYDPDSFRLPYGLENRWFRVSWEIGKGITSFYDREAGKELLRLGDVPFFTPVLERTEIRKGIYEERRLLGRNIRGLHGRSCPAELTDVEILDHGVIFDRVELTFSMEGTVHTSLMIKMYRELPRIDFTCRIGKTIGSDIESIFLPMSLDLPESSLYLHNGGVAYRPGPDQVPGSNQEYYLADEGLLFQQGQTGYLINMRDTGLLYMGKREHHPVTLCENREEDNHRPVYSWIMNNTWETNFKMDLSGFAEFNYRLEKRQGSLSENLKALQDEDMDPAVFLCE